MTPENFTYGAMASTDEPNDRFMAAKPVADLAKSWASLKLPQDPKFHVTFGFEFTQKLYGNGVN